MPRPPLHTRAAVIAALAASGGNVSAAARALGVAGNSVHGRIQRDPVIARALAKARRSAGRVALCPACGGSGVTWPIE